jgi:hypothetical protein
MSLEILRQAVANDRSHSRSRGPEYARSAREDRINLLASLLMDELAEADGDETQFNRGAHALIFCAADPQERADPAARRHVDI